MSDEPESFSEKPKQDAPPAEIRTRADRYREYIGNQITAAFVELDDERVVLDELQTKLEGARGKVREQESLISATNAKLRHYASQMRDINKGCFTPPLFDRVTGQIVAVAVDSSAEPSSAKSDAAPLVALKEYGITQTMVDLIEKSQLASDCRLATIGDLKKAITLDQWWHRKIKGFGEAKVNLLLDALVKFEDHHKPEDTRPRRCTFHQCKGALFVDGKCPNCGNTLYFERIDPESEPQPAADPRRKQCLDHDCQQSESQGIFVKHDDGGEACPECGNSKHFKHVDDEPAE